VPNLLPRYNIKHATNLCLHLKLVHKPNGQRAPQKSSKVKNPTQQDSNTNVLLDGIHCNTIVEVLGEYTFILAKYILGTLDLKFFNILIIYL
jgi:hypothetical protein